MPFKLSFCVGFLFNIFSIFKHFHYKSCDAFSLKADSFFFFPFPTVLQLTFCYFRFWKLFCSQIFFKSFRKCGFTNFSALQQRKTYKIFMFFFPCRKNFLLEILGWQNSIFQFNYSE